MESNEEGTRTHTVNRPSSRTKDSNRKGLLMLCFLGLLGALLLLFVKTFVEKEKLRISCKNLPEENDQLKAMYSTVVEERDELQTRVSKLESMLDIKCYAVDVTLDPDTAYQGLILSADGKQMRYEDILQDLPNNTKRFDSVSCAMGKEGFSSGRFYFEVDVTGTTNSDLGVASHSVDRKGEILVDSYINCMMKDLIICTNWTFLSGSDLSPDFMQKRITGPHGAKSTVIFKSESSSDIHGQGEANSHGNQGTTTYAEDKNDVGCSTDVDAHVKGCFVDLWRQKDHLIKKNADLKQALNTCEDANSELDNENCALKKQIKSMEHLVKGLGQVRVEMDSIRAALAEKEMISCGLQVWISKLQKENEALKDHLETSTNEKSDNLLAKEMDKSHTKNLTVHVQALQQQLELTRMKIAEKDEIMLNKDFVIDQTKASIDEMIGVGQDLKKKANDLKRQLELALEHGEVSGEDSSMTSDGHPTGATRNHLSVAQEFSLLSGFQESFDKEVKATETVSLQKETTDLTEDAVKELKEEGEVIIHKGAARDLTEVSESGNSTPWLNQVWTSCKRGALLGVSFGLGAVLPFCLLGVAMTSCSNFMSTDAHQAILQHGAFLPPF
ncbi:uncharacterized protein LOC125289073 isoform X2 [Alosa alosa]|uniref:uncharacterized protein LOC125289073 isoform X2 n=1 Tax=Alosa alosa TaxID=278164 RepID=UPI002015506F|nr:uncharacterized protein LOC125289073 isoform X2 [Alosa alosa]